MKENRHKYKSIEKYKQGDGWKGKFLRYLLSCLPNNYLLAIMRNIDMLGRIPISEVRRNIGRSSIMKDFNFGGVGFGLEFQNLIDLFDYELCGPRIAECSLQQGAYIFNQAKGCRNVIEIGRFKGGTTLILLFGMYGSHTDGCLYSIDPCYKEYDRDGKIGEYDSDLQEIFNRCKGFQYVPKLAIINKRSEDVNVKSDLNNVFSELIYIDGDHTCEGCLTDLVKYSERSIKGASILCDDYNGKESGVKDAVHEFLKISNKWYIHKEIGRLVHLKRNML